jgi:hypothetical protein
MSKTNFSDGNYLTPDFMNTIYGQGISGGHVHDGANDDGHASQIDLTADVQGVLPATNGGAAAASTGFFVGWLHRNSGATSLAVDATFQYRIDYPSGRATIYWDNLIAPVAWRQNDFAYYDATSGDATNFTMPTKLRPLMNAQNPIIGTAMCVKDESESSPPSGSQAYTKMLGVQIFINSPYQISFLKDRAQVWNVQSDNTVLGGQVTYSTGYTS